MVFGWSFSGHQTQDAQAYHWCELSRESTSSFPFLLRSMQLGEAEEAWLWFGKKRCWPASPATVLGATSKAISTANYRHTPGDRNDCISSSVLPRELSYPTGFLGMKSLLNIIMCQALSQILGPLSWIHFVLQLSFLAHGQLFSNRSSCFNPKGSHSLWTIKIETWYNSYSRTKRKFNNRRMPNGTRMSPQNWLSKSPCLSLDILESSRNHSGQVTKS